MNYNLPKIKKDGILDKIKNVFAKLFAGNKTQPANHKETSEKCEKTSVEYNKIDLLSNLQNQIVSEEIVSGNEILLQLQRKIKNNEMQIAELTDDELDRLIELYETQIESKKKKLENNNEVN